MILRLLGGLLLLTACGREVNIDHSALIDASKAGDAYSTSALKEGSISKMNSSSNSYLNYGVKSYKISENSSHLAKSFIKNLPTGNTPVLFQGKVSRNGRDEEMNISEIKRK